jgi:hypothetical protein
MKILVSLFILASLLIPTSAGALAYYTNPTVPVTTIPIIGYGAAGDSVVLLQQTLKRLGYFPSNVAVTGFYGMTTVQAVQGFQRANGIVATGRVGPRTQAALNNYVYVTPAVNNYTSCIPSNVPIDGYDYTYDGTHPLSIREKLRGLGARCHGGVLYTEHDRPIYFYHMKGCFRDASYEYRDVLRNQVDEIAALKKRYTVIIIPCDRAALQY